MSFSLPGLRRGDGLHCLQEPRRRDQIVPILAISGVALAEIIADLLLAGADHFIGKRELNSSVLAPILEEALTRADAWRKHDFRQGASTGA